MFSFCPTGHFHFEGGQWLRCPPRDGFFYAPQWNSTSSILHWYGLKGLGLFLFHSRSLCRTKAIHPGKALAAGVGSCVTRLRAQPWRPLVPVFSRNKISRFSLIIKCLHWPLHTFICIAWMCTTVQHLKLCWCLVCINWGHRLCLASLISYVNYTISKIQFPWKCPKQKQAFYLDHICEFRIIQSPLPLALKCILILNSVWLWFTLAVLSKVLTCG